MAEINNMSTSVEMPRYKCHKVVHAFRIGRLDHTIPSGGGLVMTPSDPGFDPIVLDAEFVRRHKPVVGGYYVVYEDDYKSFSPAKAFEEGYTPIK